MTDDIKNKTEKKTIWAKGRKSTHMIRVDDDTHAAIKEYAERERLSIPMSLSRLIAVALK